MSQTRLYRNRKGWTDWRSHILTGPGGSPVGARKEDLLGATRIASRVGEVVAYATMAIGVVAFLFVDVIMASGCSL